MRSVSASLPRTFGNRLVHAFAIGLMSYQWNAYYIIYQLCIIILHNANQANFEPNVRTISESLAGQDQLLVQEEVEESSTTSPSTPISLPPLPPNLPPPPSVQHTRWTHGQSGRSRCPCQVVNCCLSNVGSIHHNCYVHKTITKLRMPR